jgi:hypothetical protein
MLMNACLFSLSNLADTIWNLGDCSAADIVIQDNTRHVIDGGSLIQRIPWNKGATFGQISQMYLDYSKQQGYYKVRTGIFQTNQETCHLLLTIVVGTVIADQQIFHHHQLSDLSC